MTSVIDIDNSTFRRALLSLNGLSEPPPGTLLPVPTASSGQGWLRSMLRQLGFVQIDPIMAVARAHHHILFSRNHAYAQEHLKHLLEHDRQAFENWTHDAAILPMDVYPYWKHYFERTKTFEAHPGYRRYFEPVTPEAIDRVLLAIEQEGPLKPRDLASENVVYPNGEAGFTTPTLAKVTMEYLWRIGTLVVSRRDGNQKVYDLSHRVIPKAFYQATVTRDDYVAG